MFAAVVSGDAKKLAELMRQDPGFNVNMDQDGFGFTTPAGEARTSP